MRRAIYGYDEILRDYPNNIHTIEDKAEALYGLQQYREALPLYQNATTEFYHHDDTLLTDLTNIYEEIGEYENALVAWENVAIKRTSYVQLLYTFWKDHLEG